MEDSSNRSGVSGASNNGLAGPQQPETNLQQQQQQQQQQQTNKLVRERLANVVMVNQLQRQHDDLVARHGPAFAAQHVRNATAMLQVQASQQANKTGEDSNTASTSTAGPNAKPQQPPTTAPTPQPNPVVAPQVANGATAGIFSQPQQPTMAHLPHAMVQPALSQHALVQSGQPPRQQLIIKHPNGMLEIVENVPGPMMATPPMPLNRNHLSLPQALASGLLTPQQAAALAQVQAQQQQQHAQQVLLQQQLQQQQQAAVASANASVASRSSGGGAAPVPTTATLGPQADPQQKTDTSAAAASAAAPTEQPAQPEKKQETAKEKERDKARNETDAKREESSSSSGGESEEVAFVEHTEKPMDGKDESEASAADAQEDKSPKPMEVETTGETPLPPRQDEGEEGELIETKKIDGSSEKRRRSLEPSLDAAKRAKIPPLTNTSGTNNFAEQVSQTLLGEPGCSLDQVLELDEDDGAGVVTGTITLTKEQLRDVRQNIVAAVAAQQQPAGSSQRVGGIYEDEPHQSSKREKELEKEIARMRKTIAKLTAQAEQQREQLQSQQPPLDDGGKEVVVVASDNVVKELQKQRERLQAKHDEEKKKLQDKLKAERSKNEQELAARRADYESALRAYMKSAVHSLHRMRKKK